ncbi:CrcB family protein [Fictibacillus nanhaiensis]|uniref:fluoride efflux transporter FluC n=1 Tax=Fictibacillus nanhaiensis TaxID=742169 RepID=UPI001C973DFA|nr:CrcB family protein [Fictibacillus nanhaiensis]MBY6036461.1 CrcB family protein [Fictibacillus nanhaiensis]
MILVSFAVAAGGALGAIGRYYVSQHLNGSFPFGTLSVNIVGSFLLGWYVAMEGLQILDSFYAIGLLGALTTFSTIQFEAISMYSKNKRNAVVYLMVTYIIGLIASWTGFIIEKI